MLKEMVGQVFWMLFQNGKCMSFPVLNCTRSWEAPIWEMSILRMHLDDFLYHCGCPNVWDLKGDTI